jgi:alpha-amylase
MFASLEGLIEVVLSTPGWSFVTPSRALERNESLAGLSRTRQEASERIKSSGSVWLGNSMQRKAFQELYEEPLMSKADRQAWRRLQAADYFHYMSTVGAGCAKSDMLHTVFESPYDAFITYMNILRALRHEVGAVEPNAPLAYS